MKTRTLIIIGIITAIVISITYVSLTYNQEIKLSTGMMVTTDCRHGEIRHNDQCIKLEVPSHIGTLNYGIDSIVSYCEEIPAPPNSGFGMERCIPFEFVDVDELLQRIQNNNTEPLRWPSSIKLSWCADRFDSIKHEFLENFDGCDTSDCSAEPPLFSSALNNDEEFIEQGCAQFVDKWAYLTEDNDFTWNQVYWEDFVNHHYKFEITIDPERNQKCAKLFDLIMLSAPDSDLWYELTETNDFVDAQCASVVEEWEDLTEYNVWDIGLSWDNVVEHELYGCNKNEVYFSGICMTQETKDRAQSIGELENEN